MCYGKFFYQKQCAYQLKHRQKNFLSYSRVIHRDDAGNVILVWQRHFKYINFRVCYFLVLLKTFLKFILLSLGSSIINGLSLWLIYFDQCFVSFYLKGSWTEFKQCQSDFKEMLKRNILSQFCILNKFSTIFSFKRWGGGKRVTFPGK